MIGIGIDLLKMERMEGVDEESQEAFRKNVFTATEREKAEASANTLAYYSKTFAAKEAVFKCFGIGWESGVKLSEIEVYEGEFGQPLVQLSGRFAEIAAERDVTDVLVSVSYDGDYAVAVAALRGK